MSLLEFIQQPFWTGYLVATGVSLVLNLAAGALLRRFS